MLGSHKNYQNSSKHVEWGHYDCGDAVWEREGFDGSAGVLTSLAADAAQFESQCSMNLGFLSWTDEMHKANLLISSTNALSSDTASSLTSKIAFMKSCLENGRIRCGYLGRRAEIAVQQVSLSPSNIRLSGQEALLRPG